MAVVVAAARAAVPAAAVDLFYLTFFIPPRRFLHGGIFLSFLVPQNY
jgi:hypothetical protein